MSWREFVNFWLDRELGIADTIYRNYDLLYYVNRSKTTDVHTRLGLMQAGIENRPNVSLFHLLKQCSRQLMDVGISEEPWEHILIQRLQEFYVWDKMKKGDYRKYPKRTIVLPPSYFDR